MSRLFLDTNVLLRYITGDPAKQAERTYQFLSRMTQERTDQLVLSDTVIMETVFTLRSFYGLDTDAIEERVTPFFGFTEIISPSNALDWFAVFRIEQSMGVDFIDALNYLMMRQEEIETIVSFDTDFDKFDDITRQEPS